MQEEHEKVKYLDPIPLSVVRGALLLNAEVATIALPPLELDLLAEQVKEGEEGGAHVTLAMFEQIFQRRFLPVAVQHCNLDRINLLQM